MGMRLAAVMLFAVVGGIAAGVPVSVVYAEPAQEANGIESLGVGVSKGPEYVDRFSPTARRGDGNGSADTPSNGVWMQATPESVLPAENGTVGGKPERFTVSCVMLAILLVNIAIAVGVQIGKWNQENGSKVP